MNSFFKVIAIIITTSSIFHPGHGATTTEGDDGKSFMESLEVFLCENTSHWPGKLRFAKAAQQKFGSIGNIQKFLEMQQIFKASGDWKSLVPVVFPHISLSDLVVADTPPQRDQSADKEKVRSDQPNPAAIKADVEVSGRDPALPAISEQATHIATQLQLMGFTLTADTLDASLEVLEGELPDLVTNPELRIDVARALGIKPSFAMLERLPAQRLLPVAKALNIDEGPGLLQAQFLSQRIFHNGASTWFSGFEKHANTPLCPHYRRAFPKIPVVHQYNPEVSTEGGYIPLVLNIDKKLYELLPPRVRGAINPAEEIGIVFQSMRQLTVGSGGLCFRPQTWVSPQGTPIAGSTTIQWLEAVAGKAVSLSSAYSIHDGVSSPNGPRLPTKPAADPFVCWSRIQWNARSILTAHVFVPFGMETLLRRRELQMRTPQTVGEFYTALLDTMNGFEAEVQAKIRRETAAGKAPTEDDVWVSGGRMQGQVRRVFEEDLGDLFKR